MKSTLRVVAPLALAILVFAPGAAFSLDAASQGGAHALVGLWQAKRRFGPDVAGPLQIVRSDDGWRAEIAGHTVTVKVDGSALAFDLPGGQGGFRGRLAADGRRLVGRWIQPLTVSGGLPYMTPVDLAATGRGVWRGTVEPVADTNTFYLKVFDNPDGTTGVFLRNPERNAGAFIDLDHLVRVGDRVTLLGHPGGEPRDVEVATGAYDADNQMLSITVPGGEGTYDFTPAGADSGFYPRGAKPAPYRYRPPVARPDGWPVATLAEVGLSRPAIERFVQMVIDTPMDSVHAQEVHGVLIARHGKLALEEYFHGEYADKLHDTRSAAKSLTSVLIGAEIQAGAPIGPSTPVYAALNGGKVPEGLDPHKGAMTLEHLMTMSSGLYCDDRDAGAPGNENVMQNQDRQPDWYRYALDLPMASAPGEKAVYCSTNPNLAGAVLAKASGEPLEEGFARLIAGPLQFGRYALDLQPTGEPYMGGGARFLPRDFMKLGQMMLDGGVWHGRRIVSQAWARRSTSAIVTLRDHPYGYFWWGLDFPYKGGTVRAFYAAGNGGQVVMVVPDLDLVVAIYGGNYNDKVLYVPQEIYTPRYILPAVE